jgi:hypothetical protein
MGTPPLQKNGRDHAQDRALRELQEVIVELRKELVVARKNMEQSYVRNQDDHTSIIKKLTTLDRDVLVTHVRDEEKDKAETKLRRQLAALAFLFVTTATGLVSWGATQAHDLHQAVNDNTAHFKEFQAIGIRWGDDIDARDKAMQDDIRQLEKMLHEHQRRHGYRQQKE